MTRRRLIPIALVVTALLAVVAIAARGRPLGKSSGTGAGLPLTFWNILFTTLVIVVLLLAVLALVIIVLMRRERTGIMGHTRYGLRTFRTVVVIILVAALVAYVARRINLQHLHPPPGAASTLTNPAGIANGANPNSGAHVQFQWAELVIILVLLLALGVAIRVTRTRLGSGMAKRRRAAPETLAAALDESLDDLRTDPDLRRAIIAAYARMETALAAAGIARRPAEAPLEYVERALLNLDASAAAVRHLTDLFEWARFSHHEPDPSMRDEAIAALVAVRDELRASELTPV